VRLHGEVAIITGAGSLRGIGRAIAIAYADEGAHVAIVDIHREGVEETAQEIRVRGGRSLALCGDVTKAADVQKMVRRTLQEFGTIDILVNNAGFCRFVPFLSISEELWDRTMAVNVKGYFLVGQAVAREMVCQGVHGKIINVSSQCADVAGEEKVHYCASKGAVKLLTQGMALELARHGIRVNALAPGTIDTDIVQEERIRKLVEAERQHSSIPLGRMGTAQDLAGAAVFLASAESRYVTGSTLLVDGGCLAGSLLPPQFRAETC
jgi:NAD(P)-dependent dehydrogenase (short-subunit alcohol dehydrogenase family)